jgi:hypothetical protein
VPNFVPSQGGFALEQHPQSLACGESPARVRAPSAQAKGMAWTFNGVDCRTTWYIEEVNGSGLFGVDGKHLSWLQNLRVGLRIYFDDVPYRIYCSRSRHRLLGPYEVIPSVNIDTRKVLVLDRDQAVVYLEPEPERGPWLDGPKERHCGRRPFSFRQDAKSYQYFPYRFAIRPAEGFGEQFVAHPADCRGFCNV